MAGQYDIAIIGDSALAVGVAWALTRSEAAPRVVVLAPRLLGRQADPADAARLHALRLPSALTPLVPRAAVRYRAWAEQLELDPPRVNGGHVVLAGTVQSAVALRAAAQQVPSCRSLHSEERSDLLPGHDPARCLAGWHEPLATTMLAGDLVFRVAEAAAVGGADLVDGAAVQSVTRQLEGFELLTSAGTTRVKVVIDTEPGLAASRAAGLRGTVNAATHQRLTTAAMAPLLGCGVTVDDVGLNQRSSGEIDLVVPMPGPVSTTGLAAAVPGLAAVVAALPFLAGAPIVGRTSHRGAISYDGLPIVGQLAGGWWVCGALGRHEADLLPLLCESLADAALGGALDDSLAPLRPDRLRGAPSAVLPSATLLSCRTCGPRDRSQFSLVAGRLVHSLGCGRPLGADPLPSVELPPIAPEPVRPAAPAPVVLGSPPLVVTAVATAAAAAPVSVSVNATVGDGGLAVLDITDRPAVPSVSAGPPPVTSVASAPGNIFERRRRSNPPSSPGAAPSAGNQSSAGAQSSAGVQSSAGAGSAVGTTAPSGAFSFGRLDVARPAPPPTEPDRVTSSAAAAPDPTGTGTGAGSDTTSGGRP